MKQNEITEILNRPISQELLARDLTRLAYIAKDGTPRSIPIGGSLSGVYDRVTHGPGGRALFTFLVLTETWVADTPEHEPHRRPHAPPMGGPFMEFDLAAEVHRLHAETTWKTGQNARTLIKYDDFRVVLTTLKANVHLPEHKTEGRISVHVLSGHIRLRAAGRTFNLRSGGLLALDHEIPHDVEALEESAFLLTIAWPGRR